MLTRQEKFRWSKNESAVEKSTDPHSIQSKRRQAGKKNSHDFVSLFRLTKGKSKSERSPANEIVKQKKIRSHEDFWRSKSGGVVVKCTDPLFKQPKNTRRLFPSSHTSPDTERKCATIDLLTFKSERAVAKGV